MDDASHAAATAMLLLPLVRHTFTIDNHYKEATMPIPGDDPQTLHHFSFEDGENGLPAKLFQLRTTCAALDLCKCRNLTQLPKSNHCICCGCGIHFLWSLKILPFRDDIGGTEVCFECVR